MEQIPDIVTSIPEDKFTKVPNVLARNSELSGTAFKLIVILCSNKKGWTSWFKQISKQMKEGRDAIYRAMTELEDFGLLIRVRVRDKKTKRYIGGFKSCALDASHHGQGQLKTIIQKLESEGYEVLDKQGRKINLEPIPESQDMEFQEPEFSRFKKNKEEEQSLNNKLNREFFQNSDKAKEKEEEFNLKQNSDFKPSVDKRFSPKEQSFETNFAEIFSAPPPGDEFLNWWLRAWRHEVLYDWSKEEFSNLMSYSRNRFYADYIKIENTDRGIDDVGGIEKYLFRRFIESERIQTELSEDITEADLLKDALNRRDNYLSFLKFQCQQMGVYITKKRNFTRKAKNKVRYENKIPSALREMACEKLQDMSQEDKDRVKEYIKHELKCNKKKGLHIVNTWKAEFVLGSLPYRRFEKMTDEQQQAEIDYWAKKNGTQVESDTEYEAYLRRLMEGETAA